MRSLTKMTSQAPRQWSCSAISFGRSDSARIPLALEPLLQGQRSRLGTSTESGVWWLDLMGRLKSGATYEQALASLNGTFQAAALEVMPPPRGANEPAQLEENDYPRLLAESG